MPYRASGTLSERERECLTMAARGLTGEDIAFKLSISLRTVQHHFDSIRGKLNVANRLEAVTRAVQTGIISPYARSRAPGMTAPSALRTRAVRLKL
jgi:DNA-binding NarL/FixJ family response regulator